MLAQDILATVISCAVGVAAFSTRSHADDLPNYAPTDRAALTQLFEAANDWQTTIEFVVPKPKLAVRPNRQHAPRLDVPKPKLAQRLRLTRTAITHLAAFKASPFPYDGTVPDAEGPFFNHEAEGRRAHVTRTGRVYWEDETYNERRSLLHVPKGFNPNAPAVMVVYFHGHGAKLRRDTLKRQRLPQQITTSGVNAVLVAPHFAHDARDSSIGNFWRPGAFRDYLDEASEQLARLIGQPSLVDRFDKMPIILIGYSGGYVATAFAAAQGGINDRLRGIVLLDGLYGQLGTFSKWIKRNETGFFISAYTHSTRRGNNRLREILTERGAPYLADLPAQLSPGTIAFISAPVPHDDFVTNAWARYPIADILYRLPDLNSTVWRTPYTAP